MKVLFYKKHPLYNLLGPLILQQKKGFVIFHHPSIFKSSILLSFSFFIHQFGVSTIDTFFQRILQRPSISAFISITLSSWLTNVIHRFVFLLLVHVSFFVNFKFLSSWFPIKNWPFYFIRLISAQFIYLSILLSQVFHFIFSILRFDFLNGALLQHFSV